VAASGAASTTATPGGPFSRALGRLTGMVIDHAAASGWIAPRSWSRVFQAIGSAACVQGYRVRDTSIVRLLQGFAAASADGTFILWLPSRSRSRRVWGDPAGPLNPFREQMTHVATPVSSPPSARKVCNLSRVNSHLYLKRAWWRIQEKFKMHVLASCPESNHRTPIRLNGPELIRRFVPRSPSIPCECRAGF
jgi:hypothetical protein